MWQCAFENLDTNKYNWMFYIAYIAWSGGVLLSAMWHSENKCIIGNNLWQKIPSPAPTPYHLWFHSFGEIFRRDQNSYGHNHDAFYNSYFYFETFKYCLFNADYTCCFLLKSNNFEARAYKNDTAISEIKALDQIQAQIRTKQIVSRRSISLKVLCKSN